MHADCAALSWTLWWLLFFGVDWNGQVGKGCCMFFYSLVTIFWFQES